MSDKNKVVMHCFAEKEGDQWQAICLNYDLAVQGDSLRDVRTKLEAMVDDYIEEAETTDRAHAAELLNRRAPVKLWLRYWAMKAHLLRTSPTASVPFHAKSRASDTHAP